MLRSKSFKNLSDSASEDFQFRVFNFSCHLPEFYASTTFECIIDPVVHTPQIRCKLILIAIALWMKE